jgi:hypothetical protein
MQRRLSHLDWIVVDIILMFACYLGFDLLVVFKKAVPSFSIVCDFLSFLMLITALYCTQQFARHGWRLARKLDEERSSRIAAENAPISLGLHRNPRGSYTCDEEDELSI